METKDILIIDDEEVILDAVKKIGKMEGFTVEAALNPLLALDMLEKENYKLILCDIMMPEMDGFQIIDELYKRKLNIPVIMITGYSTVENAVKSLYKGAIDFIPKPFTFDELMSSISRGFKYLELQKQIEGTQYNTSRDSIIYVPCPPKYMKLGFTSWMLLEQEGIAVMGATDLFLRTVDTITNIELMKRNYPPLLIKDKDKYIDSIIECEKTNNIKSVFSIFIEDLSESMTKQLNKSKELKITKRKNKGLSM